MLKKIVVLVALAAVAACTTHKTPVATSGSKSDGMVRMSFQTGGFERPQVDWTTAQRSASQRCQAWGYSHAQAFGGQVQECVAANAYGCIRANVHTDYQCLD
ncbi:MAG: YecR family lipoprotein [Paracoccaceae bacterium]